MMRLLDGGTRRYRRMPSVFILEYEDLHHGEAVDSSIEIVHTANYFAK